MFLILPADRELPVRDRRQGSGVDSVKVTCLKALYYFHSSAVSRQSTILDQ